MALELSLELGMKPVVVAPVEMVWKRLGIKTQGVAADAVTRAHRDLHGGLQILEVAPGGVAASAGIQKGDILVGLQTWETLRVDDIVFVLNHKDYASFLPLKYVIVRNGKLSEGLFAGSP